MIKIYEWISYHVPEILLIAAVVGFCVLTRGLYLMWDEQRRFNRPGPREM